LIRVNLLGESTLVRLREYAWATEVAPLQTIGESFCCQPTFADMPLEG